jgi:hypothetical protein
MKFPSFAISKSCKFNVPYKTPIDQNFFGKNTNFFGLTLIFVATLPTAGRHGVQRGGP